MKRKILSIFLSFILVLTNLQIPILAGAGDGSPILESLKINYENKEIALSPAFDSTVIEYSAAVPESVQSININAVVTDSTYSLAIKNVPVTTDEAYTVDLEEGTNEIEIAVTAPEGNQTVYTITINRGLDVYKDPSQPVEARVEDLLSKMTLEEKVGQMLQPEALNITPEQVKELYIGSVLSGGDSDPTNGNSIYDWYNMVTPFVEASLQTRLGIPIIYGIDAVHGNSNVEGATIFPHNIGLGAIATGSETDGVRIVKEIGAATAEETKAINVPWSFAPCLANPQDISWGRTYEGFSEDVNLVSKLGVAYVQGLQGENYLEDLKEPNKAVASVKHYLGEGYTDDGTNQGNVSSMTKEEVAEKLLKPYADAIKAGARTVMPSYNSIQGIKMHASKYLLTDVLKGDLQFDGFVISDYNAIDQITIDEEGNPVSGLKDQVRVSINAGNDMLMEVAAYKESIEFIKELVQEEQENPGSGIPISRIDDAVKRILRVKFQAGLFENPITPDPADNPNILNKLGSQEHRDLAREAVSKSLVLLKNDEVNGSPILSQLNNMDNVLIAGESANNIGIQCGGWTIKWQGQSGDITTGTTILEGIKNAIGDEKVTYNADGTGAAGKDVAILVVGEAPYAETNGDDLNKLSLNAADRAALENLKAAGIPIVMVVVSGRPMLITDQLNDIDGLVAAWLPGTEGAGVADVLFGNKDFVGKLPTKWPFYFESISVVQKDSEQVLFNRDYGLKKAEFTPDLPAKPLNPYDKIPEGAVAAAVPGKIEAEKFTWNSGFNVSEAEGVSSLAKFDEGDYAKYYIDVPKDGIYTVEFKYSTIRDLKDAVSIKDQKGNVGGPLTFTKNSDVKYSGGFVFTTNWSTVTQEIELQAGKQLLEIYLNALGTPSGYEPYIGGPAKLDYINITSGGGTSTVATPKASPYPAVYKNAQEVELFSATEGAAIYYTTDGSIPTTSSTLYKEAIKVSSTTTIKAIAIKDGMTNSNVVTLEYVIDPTLVQLKNLKGVTDKSVINETIEKVIDAMTLDEKVSVLVGPGMSGTGIVGMIDKGVPGAAGNVNGVPRLGIPAIVLADGPAGLRINPTREGDNSTYYATAFPIGTALASTWDTTLVNEVGKAVGNEVKEYGVDLWLAPALNIQRNPLCSRNFEYYSEDPLLAGKITADEVNGVESQGVGTTIKHFAANNQEANRLGVDTVVSERALREIYLRGFEIAVKDSQPWSVMSSYNKINGIHASKNNDLLTKVLRDDWGFEGFVMTDWYGGFNSFRDMYMGGSAEAVKQMEAGNDVIEPGSDSQKAEILAAINAGTLDEKVLDTNLARVLKIVLETPKFKEYQYSNKPNLAANAALSRKAAAEAMTLLKNEGNALPINKDTAKVALFGNAQIETIKGGLGSGNVNVEHIVSIAEGFDEAFNLDETLKSEYSNYVEAQRATDTYKPVYNPMSVGYTYPYLPEMSVEGLNSTVQSTDIAVITIARNSSEGDDRKDSKGDFRLTDSEIKMIDDVSAAYHNAGKKVVVVLNIGGVIEVASWRDKVDGILLAWQPGQEAGYAIADVVSGAVNPSGKLPQTFPMSYSDVPSAKGTGAAVFPGTPADNPAKVVYEDGVYVGYRYYDAFNVPVAYEFGYGKNYSTFDYSKLALSTTTFNNNMNVSVDIANTSSVPGKEVVQLYVGAPGRSMDKPVKELRDFGKTKVLNSNATETLTFALDAMDLASFDTERSAWVVEPGTYTVYAAASSKDIRETATFKVASEIVVETVNKALAPKETINEMKAPEVKVSAPIALLAAGSYKGTQYITLTCESGANIYYTIDGSTPTSSSTAYSKPITVSATTTVKAIAVKNGKSSAIAEFIYTISSGGGGSSSGGGSSTVKAVTPVTPTTPVTPVNQAPSKTVKISLASGAASNGGESLKLSVKPYAQNGRTMVGVRDIAVLLNVNSKDIVWDAKNKSIIIKTADKEIKLILGQKYAIVNGKKVVIDVAPQAKDGRTVLPIAHVAKLLGIKVEFNPTTKEVTFVTE